MPVDRPMLSAPGRSTCPVLATFYFIVLKRAVRKCGGRVPNVREA